MVAAAAPPPTRHPLTRPSATLSSCRIPRKPESPNVNPNPSYLGQSLGGIMPNYAKPPSDRIWTRPATGEISWSNRPVWPQDPPHPAARPITRWHIRRADVATGQSDH